MPRIIKFRAWYSNKMIPVGSLDFFTDGSIYVNEELVGAKLMQHTGLKDKNGKEIYEGDILKHDLWGKTQIIWEHGMFRGTNGKDWNEMIDITLADHQLKRCKVIGNIYENPELLK